MNDPLQLQNVYCVKAITMQSAETLFFYEKWVTAFILHFLPFQPKMND